MSKEVCLRLRLEIDEVLKHVDLEQLKAGSVHLLNLANSIETRQRPLIVMALASALGCGACKSQDVEAVLRLCGSDFWIGAPDGEVNLAIQAPFCTLVSGIYSIPGSYRENFEDIALAGCTLVIDGPPPDCQHVHQEIATSA
jgi:hypothetical protein